MYICMYIYSRQTSISRIRKGTNLIKKQMIIEKRGGDIGAVMLTRYIHIYAYMHIYIYSRQVSISRIRTGTNL